MRVGITKVDDGTYWVSFEVRLTENGGVTNTTNIGVLDFNLDKNYPPCISIRIPPANEEDNLQKRDELFDNVNEMLDIGSDDILEAILEYCKRRAEDNS